MGSEAEPGGVGVGGERVWRGPSGQLRPGVGSETRATWARPGGRGPNRAGLVTCREGGALLSGAVSDGAWFVGAVWWGGIWGSGVGLWQKGRSPELFTVAGQVPGCPLPS